MLVIDACFCLLAIIVVITKIKKSYVSIAALNLCINTHYLVVNTLSSNVADRVFIAVLVCATSCIMMCNIVYYDVAACMRYTKSAHRHNVL